ncbi:unnamed protein product [Albugo candida]|uniref:CHCH domain-containing protein n=1 Tax=Albugo candida TaxID=65357 RepID=A0A024GNE4_9STRA|nr:unnamed protein product [Albugo candida]|eukprot:CCI48254.1 unnamed protein product [Albugo candida]
MNKESSRKSPSTDSTSLKCAWRIIGRECNETNLAFLNCKAENDHPTACLSQGEKAVACGLRV